MNIQTVISRSIYQESFYEVAGFSINLSALFIQQKLIKILVSLLNVCKRAAEPPPPRRPSNAREAARPAELLRAAGSSECMEAVAEGRLGN